MAKVRVLKRRVMAHHWRDPGAVVEIGDKLAAHLIADDPGAFELVEGCGLQVAGEQGNSEEPMAEDIGALGLAVRTEKALRDFDVHTVEQLRVLVANAELQAAVHDDILSAADDLKSIKGIGKASAEEIVTALEAYDGDKSAG